MKKRVCFILFLILINSICFAKTENISAIINKKITINYSDDVHECRNNYYNEDGENGTYALATKYVFKNCRFFDEKSNEIFPISYEGTTYLPVRAISSLLDIRIKWDGNTNSITLGEGIIDYSASEYLEKETVSEIEKVNVIRNEDIKIYYNGEMQSFFDVNGKRVYPISYKGSTYLPVRAVVNLFDILIDWEGQTNTIFIKGKSSSKIFENNEIKVKLARLTDEELEIALNEVFAYYGHDFDTQRIEDYFIQKKWYKKIEGKKVSMSDLTIQEQQNIEKIQQEINRRKTYKDINTLKQPDVINIENYKVVEILKDDAEKYYSKIYNTTQEALNPTITNANVSYVELLPSKVYLMNDNYGFYYTFESETYYVPVEKVSSPEEERIVLMEPNIEIYNNGDLIINDIKKSNFFDVEFLKDSDIYHSSKYYSNIIEFLLSTAPISNTYNKQIGFEYNFDNDLHTSEYIFNIVSIQPEGSLTWLDSTKKLILSNKEDTEYHTEIIHDVNFNKNIAGYSNLFLKYPGWFDDLKNLNEGYSLKYYEGTSMLNTYIKERFVDVYYIFIPNHGFELVNKTLEGKDVIIQDYTFTLAEDMILYSEEKYECEYGRVGALEEYDKVWYSVNEQYEDSNVEEDSIINEYDTIVVKAGTKVKLIYAEGWWHIAFEIEGKNEAFVIYFTPAGVT